MERAEMEKKQAQMEAEMKAKEDALQKRLAEEKKKRRGGRDQATTRD